ncbi:MAG: hypothetical protein Q9212_007220, partial [Teloschistes hypoglaucus]
MTKEHGPAPHWLPKSTITSLIKFKTAAKPAAALTPPPTPSSKKTTTKLLSLSRPFSAFRKPLSSFNPYRALASAFRRPLPASQPTKLPTTPFRIWCGIKPFCSSATMA